MASRLPVWDHCALQVPLSNWTVFSFARNRTRGTTRTPTSPPHATSLSFEFCGYWRPKEELQDAENVLI